MSDSWAVFEDATLAQGFTQIPNAVTRNASLSMQARFMYGLLLSYAWQDSTCFPGLERMRSDTGCKVDTLRKYIYELKDAGLIDVKPRGQGKTNRYIFKALTASQDNPQRGLSKPPPSGVFKTTPNGVHNEDSVDEDSVDNSRRGAIAPTEEKKEPTTPSAFQYMNDYADLLNDAMALSGRERGKLARAIQKRLDNGDEPKKLRTALCRMVARRQEGVRLELEDALNDLDGKKPAAYEEPHRRRKIQL